MKRKRSYSNNKSGPYKKRQQTTPQPRVQNAGYKLYKQVKQEFKIWDKDLALVNANTTGAIYSLQTAGTTTAALTRGSDYYNNFIGQNLDVAGLQMRYELNGCISNAVLTADQYNHSRVILFQWLDSSTPSVSGVLQSPTDPLSPVLATNRPIINVLHDKIWSTYAVHSDSTGGTTSDVSSIVHNKKVYLKGWKFAPIQMDVGSATYQKGGLYILVMGDSSVAPNPTFRFYVRTTFTD